MNSGRQLLASPITRLVCDKKWRVIFSGLAITALPIVCLAVFIYLQVAGYIERNILAENRQSALVCSDQLKKALDNEISLGNLLVSRPLLKDAVKSADRKEIMKHLKDFMDNSVTTDRAYVTDIRGAMLAEYPNSFSTLNTDMSRRPWYKTISRNWLPLVSDFYLRTAKPQRYVFAIVLPIRTDDGRVIGIFVLQPKDSYFQNALTNVSGLEQQTVYVVDRKGNLIYHSRHVVDKIVDLSGSPAVRKIRTGRAGVETLPDRDGRSMLTAYNPIEGYGWGVVVERPEGEVFAPLRKITYGLFAFASVMLLTGFYFAYRRSNLIYSLHKFSEELETRVEKRTDELNATNKQLSTEIEDRKKIEETLLKEKNFSETVINSLPSTFYLFSEEGRFLKWNRKMEEVTGYTTDEITKMTPLDFFDEEDKPLIAEKIQEVVANGKAEVEARLTSKDRKRVPYYFTGRLLDVGGQACVAGSGFDITGRVYAEEKTKQAYTELDQIFNNSADGMRVLDTHFNPHRLNRTFLDMTNLKEEDAMKKKCYEMFPCPRRKTGKCSMVRVLKGEMRFEEEVVIERNDGAKIFSILTVTPFYDSNGAVIGIIESFKDITERKKLEDQLILSQKMEAVGRLAGGIAHDFNNLMTAVIGYSDMVLSELPAKHFAMDKIRTVRDTGVKASDLVRQLLAFSNNHALEMTPVNLNEIVWNMNKIFERTIGEDIELELNINNPVKNVLADPGQIEQILMNLVVNARDAMPDGGRLMIETDSVYLDEAYALMHSQLVKPGHYVMLSATDNGTGMSPEVREKIFEPFFTTKGAGRGTGLGLSTTYGIIRQHNGYIWAYSEPGQGTTFKVYLPTIEEEAKEIKQATEVPSLMTEGTETILVVDDDPLIRQFVMAVLQPKGYKLYEADNGEQALKIAEQLEGKIDLLLTDIIMPGMNGTELRRSFIGRWPGIKSCLMSGYGGRNIPAEGIEGIKFINKPLSPQKILTTLRELLDSPK